MWSACSGGTCESSRVEKGLGTLKLIDIIIAADPSVGWTGTHTHICHKRLNGTRDKGHGTQVRAELQPRAEVAPSLAWRHLLKRFTASAANRWPLNNPLDNSTTSTVTATATVTVSRYRYRYGRFTAAAAITNAASRTRIRHVERGNDSLGALVLCCNRAHIPPSHSTSHTPSYPSHWPPLPLTIITTTRTFSPLAARFLWRPQIMPHSALSAKHTPHPLRYTSMPCVILI